MFLVHLTIENPVFPNLVCRGCRGLETKPLQILVFDSIAVTPVPLSSPVPGVKRHSYDSISSMIANTCFGKSLSLNQIIGTGTLRMFTPAFSKFKRSDTARIKLLHCDFFT
jgi:hypothetical protein